MADARTLAIFAPFLAATLYGLSYAVSQKLFASIGLTSYVLASNIVGIVALLCVHLFTPYKVNFAPLADPSTLGLFAVSVGAALTAWLFTIFAIRSISANYAAVGEISYPLFTVLFGYLIYGRKLDWSMALGACLILGGSFLIASDKLNGR